MPVRLNITIDEDIHERLTSELPTKGISRFINEAVRARLRPGRNELDRAYLDSLELAALANRWAPTVSAAFGTCQRGHGAAALGRRWRNWGRLTMSRPAVGLMGRRRQSVTTCADPMAPM